MFSSNTLTMPLKHTMQDVSLMLFHVFCGVSRKRLINVRNMLSYYVLQGIFAQHLPKYFDDINKRFYYICDMLMELMFCFFYQQYVVITSFGSGFNKFYSGNTPFLYRHYSNVIMTFLKVLVYILSTLL